MSECRYRESSGMNLTTLSDVSVLSTKVTVVFSPKPSCSNKESVMINCGWVAPLPLTKLVLKEKDVGNSP